MDGQRTFDRAAAIVPVRTNTRRQSLPSNVDSAAPIGGHQIVPVEWNVVARARTRAPRAENAFVDESPMAHGLPNQPQQSSAAPVAKHATAVVGNGEDTLVQRSVRTACHRRVVAGLASAVVLFVPLAARAQGPAGSDDPPGRVARLSALVGAVSFQSAGSDSWSKPAVNYTVTTGDRLYAPQGSRVELDMGASAVRVGDQSDVTVTNLTDHFAQFGLAHGMLRASIYRWIPSDSIELDTPNGALLPLTAGSYRVSVDANSDITTVTVENGSLEVSGPGLTQTLRRGQTVQLSGANPIQLTELSSGATDDFERWSMARDQRYTSAAPGAQYVNQDMPGWEDLNQYGSWYADPTVGPVWYPSAIAVDWVPYREGHWAWVEPWGWSWVDDAPWGFAPFHYGRWARFDRGWGWVPGVVVERPVYAPALVVFVGGAGFRVRNEPPMQAWFPLGPREPFFPWYHHSDRYLHDVNVTGFRTVAEIDRSTRGVDVDQVRWRNREAAITAVHKETLRNGDPVSRDVVRLRPDDIAAAHVEPHPAVNPSRRLFAGGVPDQRPPTVTRPMMVAGGAPLITKHAPPPVPAGPAPSNRQLPTLPREDAAAPGRSANQRPIITRNPPPQPPPSPDVRGRAMEAHPGRPLEPQQRQAIRAGRPAGPQRDAEVPAHPAPPADRSAKPSRPPDKKPGRV